MSAISRVPAAILLLVLPAGITAVAAAAEPLADGTLPGPLPSGSYTIDPAHTSVLARVSHLGFSHYTLRFTGFDARLELDPRAPELATLEAVIDPASIATHYPLDDMDFDAYLAGPEWLDAEAFPEITFRSTDIVLTGDETARVEGELTLMGHTRPFTLETRFNGGYAGHVFDPNARIGFSATGSFSRSAYGLDFGLPPMGSTIGVGDAVEIIIETEFLQPHD